MLIHAYCASRVTVTQHQRHIRSHPVLVYIRVSCPIVVLCKGSSKSVLFVGKAAQREGCILLSCVCRLARAGAVRDALHG
jgi:hypothetical protein